MGKKRIGTLVDRLYLEHYQNPIIPVYMDVGDPQRTLGFNRTSERDSSARSLGKFYELMTKGLYGGRLGKFERLEDDSGFTPDVVDEERKRTFESKACYSGKAFKLRDDQIRGYGEYQLKKPEHRVYVAVYRHDFAEIMSYKSDVEELYKEMSNRTICSVVLPFSLGFAFFKHRGDETYRYDGEKSHVSTHVRSTLLNDIFRDFRGTLKIMGIDSGDYEFRRLMSPMDFCVDENKIRQFPVLWVDDKNHGSWLIKFKKEFDELVFQTSFFDDASFNGEPDKDYDPRNDGCSDEVDFRPSDGNGEMPF